jgi:hypothetical protein
MTAATAHAAPSLRALLPLLGAPGYLRVGAGPLLVPFVVHDVTWGPGGAIHLLARMSALAPPTPGGPDTLVDVVRPVDAARAFVLWSEEGPSNGAGSLVPVPEAIRKQARATTTEEEIQL